jgi:hypothetical protein
MIQAKATKRQHYVSRFYLKNWLSSRGNKKDALLVTGCSNNKQRECTDLNSISQKRFFYQLDISQNVFDMILAKYYEKAKQNNFLKSFIEEMNVLLEVHKYKNDKKHNYEKLNIIGINILEKKYAYLESTISSSLNLIIENIEQYIYEILTHKKYIHSLLVFFFIQSFRTLRIYDKLKEEIKELHCEKGRIKVKLSENEKDNFIKVLQYLEAFEAVENIMNSSYSIELLKNKTNINFYTSDSPAIILNSIPMSKFEGVIPLTPKLLMFVRGFKVTHTFTQKNIYNKKIVKKYNHLIQKNAYREFYKTL